MQFANLYHCTKDAKGEIGFKYIGECKDISKFDVRTRNSHYISPEQVQIGRELNDIAEMNNGKLDPDNQAIIDFITESSTKITKKCDIYSLGAILYKFLIGSAPLAKISGVIGQKRLQENSPNANVYEVPFFAQKRILSNEMCQIMVKLLHDNPKHRFKDLKEIKSQLLILREHIFNTPKLLRKVLRHPILPGEKLEPLDIDQPVDFHGEQMDKFSLKYLAKFICEYDIKSISINGSIDRPMPIEAI